MSEKPVSIGDDHPPHPGKSVFVKARRLLQSALADGHSPDDARDRYLADFDRIVAADPDADSVEAIDHYREGLYTILRANTGRDPREVAASYLGEDAPGGDVVIVNGHIRYRDTMPTLAALLARVEADEADSKGRYDTLRSVERFADASEMHASMLTARRISGWIRHLMMPPLTGRDSIGVGRSPAWALPASLTISVKLDPPPADGRELSNGNLEALIEEIRRDVSIGANQGTVTGTLAHWRIDYAAAGPLESVGCDFRYTNPRNRPICGAPTLPGRVRCVEHVDK